MHLGDERFGSNLDFGGDRLFVHNIANRGTAESGEIQVFDATTGDLLPGFRVLPNDAGDVYTYTLLDDAGGRFSLDGNQLLVADGVHRLRDCHFAHRHGSSNRLGWLNSHQITNDRCHRCQ